MSLVVKYWQEQNTRMDENQPWAFLLFSLLLIYNNYGVTILSCKTRQGKYGLSIQKQANAHQMIIFHFRMPLYPWSGVWGHLTWWLCVLRRSILQSRWGGSWGESSCSAGAEVRVQWPHMGPWSARGPHWAGKVAGALAGQSSWAGGAAWGLWRFSCGWVSRRGEL